MLKPPPRPAPLLPAVMLTLLVLNLTGCAAPSVSPVAVCPANPPPPALSEPLPPETYSLSARRLMQSWHERLTATPVTPAR